MNKTIKWILILAIIAGVIAFFGSAFLIGIQGGHV